MTPYEIAAVYRSGDLPFRPRYLNRLFALRQAMRSPVAALQIARAMPNEPTRHRFEIDLESYAASPLRWKYHEVWMKRAKPIAFAIGFVLLPLSAQAQSWPAPPSLYGSSGGGIYSPVPPPVFSTPTPYGWVRTETLPNFGTPYQPQMPTSRPCVPAAGDRC